MNWKECYENPTKQDIENGRYDYAVKINKKSILCRELEDLANEINSKSDWKNAFREIDKFYSMRERFNEW
jgi:hypothetical protein